MADHKEDSWAHLLSITETKSPIRLRKKTITIGRKSDCDISFATNKLISSNHCSISQDADGTVWLTDTSTNGTVINGNVVKGKKAKVKHNDKIHLIHRKNKPEDDISYIFQDLKCLRAEFDNLDSTQEYNFDDVSGIPRTERDTNDAKRPAANKSNELEPDAKKVKHDNCEVEHKGECSEPDVGEIKPGKSDKMGEVLICGICQDIFHDCLSLQPCMHSFCCSCYSQWMEKSSDCPTCRLSVQRMSRNHIVNNLVEAYLMDHPEKRRPADELAEMDARNKITSDMIQPKKRRHDYDDYDHDHDSDVGTDESSENDLDEGYEPAFEDDLFRTTSFASLIDFYASNITTRSWNVTRPVGIRPTPYAVCRWCPSVRSGTSSADTTRDHGTTSTEATSLDTSGSQSTSETSHPQCPAGMTHIMCVCCIKPMPKQESLLASQTGTAHAKTQKCGLCNNFYCHLLWKCNRLGCRGCLNEFKDLDFDVTCLDILVMNNKYESTILKNYLNEKAWTVRDLQQKCLEKLDNKQYRTIDCITKPELSSKYILCYHCGLKNFRELVYQFRRDIPRDELPAAVTSRPDCHWGKNCRTQINPANPHHASRFNHICEQTRFR